MVPIQTYTTGLMLTVLLLPVRGQAEDLCAAPSNLERSYWVHASMGLFTQKGYWGAGFPATRPPTRKEVENVAQLLSVSYATNRLYLIYNKEISVQDARRIFIWWREACPKSVELVPALVLRMYDEKQTPVFTAEELYDLADFFQREINATRVAVYDVYEKRDQTDQVAKLAKRFPRGMIRVGLQPSEKIAEPFVAAVQDTWSGFCHGTRNREDWLQPGFGAEILRKWVRARNSGITPVAWNLVTVTWDYRVTERGGFPGYDDADKNMPLPAGRNRTGVRLIVEAAERDKLAGFSNDLYILNENSRSAFHDGKRKAFYQTLREGKEYGGYYAVPFREIVDIFRDLKKGRWPAE